MCGEGFDVSEDGIGRGMLLVFVIVGVICVESFSGGVGGCFEGVVVGYFIVVYGL